MKNGAHDLQPLYSASVDRHLKERLVGAAVLAAVAYILIPEMLDGPRDAVTPAPSGEPAVDGGMKSYTIDLTAPKTREVESPPAQQAEKPAPKPTDSMASKPERAPEKPSAAAPADGAWAVQVASFGARATSERIAEELKANGFSAYVVTFVAKEQTMYRVRVGPVRDRDAAEALLAKVKPLHPNAAIVTK